MGGVWFEVHKAEPDVQAAFAAAWEEAAHEQGVREDSGTIATKDSFDRFAIEPLVLPVAQVLAKRLRADPRFVEDRWNDHFDTVAGAIPVADHEGGPRTGWLFFGYANE